MHPVMISISGMGGRYADGAVPFQEFWKLMTMTFGRLMASML